MLSSISSKARKFLTAHDVAVLSTVSRSGQVQGAAVYYKLGKEDQLHVLTKSDSTKAHNMIAHPQVAMTIYDPIQIQTVQLEGRAHIEGDLETKRQLFDHFVKPRTYDGEKRMPPVSKLSAGGYIAFRIEPTKVKYSDYKDDAALIPSHEQRH